jgi:peptidyl-prolyl cis-trans isomerase C
MPDAQMAQMKNEVLESLIDRELLFQESKKKGIQIKTEAVSGQLQKIKQRYPNQEEFKKLLSSMDLTEADVQAQIARGMAIQELIDKEVAEKIKVSDEETKAFYDKNPQLFQQPEQVKASHILIKVQSDAPDEQKAEARKKIESVQQKVKKGEDFATLAKTYSEGPSGPRGGDLGYFGRGQMVKPFEEAAFSLKPNETSDIVETRFGYHLIKVDDKKPAAKMAYAEVKDRLSAHLKKQKTDSETSAYIETLRKDAKIEKFL